MSSRKVLRGDLVSVLRGTYRRVAERLHVHPSYVSRVARGERKSPAIEKAIKKEMLRILKSAGNHGKKSQGR
jgi:DNA-binding transcriptional regulator YdaS (Cro superfamily)